MMMKIIIAVMQNVIYCFLDITLFLKKNACYYDFNFYATN